MTKTDSLEELLKKVKEIGGIGLIPTPTGIKIALAIDRQNPGIVFDQINKLDISLTILGVEDGKQSTYEQILDQIRIAAINHVKSLGFDINAFENIPNKYKHC